MSEELNVDIDQTVTSNDNVLPASKETEDGDEEFLDAKEDCSEANSQLTTAAQSGINNIQTAAHDNTQPICNESGDGQNLETNEDVDSCAEDTSMQPTEPESVETTGRETDTVQNTESKTFEEPTNRSEIIQSIDVDLQESSNAENQDSLSMNNKPDDSTGESNDVSENVNDTILCDGDQHSIPKVHIDNDNDKVNEEDHVSKNESSETSVDDDTNADQDAVNETDETEEGEEYMSDDEDIPLPGRRGKDEHSGDETYSESAENEEFEEEEIEEDDESDEEESEKDDESDGNYSENRQHDRHSEKVQETGDAPEINENNQDKQEPNEIEADKDKENPMYVPRTGRYYMHDSRGNEEESPEKTVNEKETRRGINADRWQNDLYIESEQGPVTPKKMGQRGRQERGRYSSRPYGAVHNNDFRRQERQPISNPFRRQNHPRSDNIPVHDNQRIESNRKPPNITENININQPSSSRGGKSGLTPNKSESNISGGSSRIAKNNISDPRPPTRGRGRGKPRGYPEDKPVGHSFEPHLQDKRESYDRNSFREDNYRKPTRPNYSAYRSPENNVEQSYDNRSFPSQFGSRSGRGRGRGRNPRNPSPTGDPVKDMQAQRITDPGEQVPNRKSPLKSGRFKNDNVLEENIRNELPKQNKPSYSLEFKNSKFRDQISNKFRNDRNYTKDRFHEETAPRFSQNRSQISVDEQHVGGKPVSDSNYNPPKRYSETRSEQAGLRPIRPQSYQKIDEQITTNVNSQSSVSAQPPVETKSPNNTNQENASLPAAAAGVQQQLQQMKPVSFIQNPNLPGQMQYDPVFLQQQFVNFVQQHMQQTQMIPPAAVPHPPQETANFASINPNPSGGTVYYTQSTAPIMPAQIQTQQFQKRQRMPLEVKNPDEP